MTFWTRNEPIIPDEQTGVPHIQSSGHYVSPPVMSQGHDVSSDDGLHTDHGAFYVASSDVDSDPSETTALKTQTAATENG